MVGRGGVVVLLLAALAVGCGDDAADVGSGASPTTAAPSTSTTLPSTTAVPVEVPTELAPASPTTEPPTTWFAVEHRGDQFVLVRGSTDGGGLTDITGVADDAGAPETSLPQSTSDLAVSSDGSMAYVAFCCEPVSGVILSVPTDGGSDLMSFDQGHHLDIADVYVRSDTEGVLRWTVGAPTATSDQSIVDAGAIDVASDHTGAVVALVDAAQGASTVRTYDGDGAVVDEVDLGGVHCALLATTDSLIATVGESRTTEHESTCVGDRFTLVVGTSTGDVSLDVALQDLETDVSGGHLIGVDEQGNVVQVVAGDEVVPLTEGRTFVAADW